ncbi:TrlF family AAA-like ATPase [Acinetobacter modestus]|uniref:TrlF family AAA-like ATPase n=1 Tax=Acinetobacter modestus TaxID=1776740 RepID=UPI001F4B8FAB|nr:AAA family ATPase [Acinetobacter modestus]MCH7333990.1 AAA family ATPase [Acinetobacter modestus]
MLENNIGSVWKKWDLHVHTPESFVHNYPGDKEAAWESFLVDLETLPSDFKVIGINDYVLVDGYERVLKEKKAGRLANIDLILPVVELRIDKFAGVVKGCKTGGFTQSAWSRVNLHVIFDQVPAELIRQQFISAIAPSYKLIPGTSPHGQWQAVITRDSIEQLGNTIINSTPENQRDHYGPALLEGFNNLNISYEAVLNALSNQNLSGKYIIAVGKTEWEDLKWEDHTIAEKKTLINNADLVFTAAESPASYQKAKEKLNQAQVNSQLLDCSDAHWLSTSSDKDRIGNCFTWIKADSSFKGLLQAIEEFDSRVYVGDYPPKRYLTDRNRTKFIQSISIKKTGTAHFNQPWFDANIPLNPDLVAIIGNKGSGKSALADIIALAGNTKNFESFSFLTATRFRHPKSKLAQHFEAKLTWLDNSETSQNLDKNPETSSVERVKYLPQKYLDDLCNELGEKGATTFDAELRKIIYSHVPEDDRLGKQSMDELLEFKVAEINKTRDSFRQNISKLNREILDVENSLTKEFKDSLNQQLKMKQAELAALEDSKPHPVDDPNTSPEAQEESKEASETIDRLEQQLQQLNNEEATLRETRSKKIKNQAIVDRVKQSLANYSLRHQEFMHDLHKLIEELEEPIDATLLVNFQINYQQINDLRQKIALTIEQIDSRLHNRETDSISLKREALQNSISEFKSKLGERQRLFVQYKENLTAWEKAKNELKGANDKPNTIEWYKSQISALKSLPEHLESLKDQRIKQTKKIHKTINVMVDEYKRLYGPVQSFVQSTQQMDLSLPLEFHVRIEESAFEDQLFNRLNRQSRGSFSGINESALLLRSIIQETDFNDEHEATEFAKKIDYMLHFDHREGQQNRETRLTDQIRRGIDSNEVLDLIYGLDYLNPRYSLTFDQQEIGQLSPGERGLLLLVFYLLVDKDDTPIVIDQPEENLDNQTIFKVLVKCIKAAKERRQVIMVTHNPNLAVVCDAEQIIHASHNKTMSQFIYETGAIEHSQVKDKVVQVLEGTEPAFKNRQSKYKLT